MGRIADMFARINHNKQQKRSTRTDPSPLLRRLNQRQATGWESQAWKDYETVPEIKRAVDYHADNMSRVRLYVGRPDPTGVNAPEEIRDPAALAPLRDLFGGLERHSRMLHRWTQLRKIVGEAYIIAYNAPVEEEVTLGPGGLATTTPSHQMIWTVASPDEIERSTSTKITVPFDSPAGLVYHEIDTATESIMVIRDWVASPRKQSDATSPVRSLREVAEVIRGADEHVRATVDSRLAGAGLLFLDSSVDIMPINTSTDALAEPGMSALATMMTTPLHDRGSASAVVPGWAIYSGDKDIDKIAHHMTFATEFDSTVPTIIERSIRRIGVALDTPQEVVSGVNDTNHWNALFTGQDAVRTAFGSPLSAMMMRLTDSYLRPYYRVMGNDDQYGDLVLWWDASELILPPDRSQIALDTYATDPAIISRDAVRRETGFAPEDAGDDTLPPPQPRGAQDESLAAVSATASSDAIGRPSAPRSPGRIASTGSQ